MLQVDMSSTVRTVFGKGEMRRLRRQNKTPAVMYSGGEDTLALEVDTADLHKKLLFIHGRNAVVNLNVTGEQAGRHHVLVQEIQVHPVTDKLIHVDFLEIDLEKPIEFMVPLKFTGTAKGVDMGGELRVIKHAVRLRGKPLDIPDEIETDITSLGRGGDGLTFSEIKIPAGVEMLEDPGVTCVMVD